MSEQNHGKVEILNMLDNEDMLQVQRGQTIYKLREWKGHKGYYVEIDVEEYDKRVHALAQKIASMPQVDLLSILRDALYDIPLKRLEKVEEMIEKELSEATLENREPKIETNARRRGTCVNLNVGGRFALELREWRRIKMKTISVEQVGHWAEGFGFGGFLAITLAMWGDMDLVARIAMVVVVTVIGVLPWLPKQWLPKLHFGKAKLI